MRLNNGSNSTPTIVSKYVQQRELGLKFSLGFRDKLNHKIYSSLRSSDYWDNEKARSCRSGNSVHGGVFNLEYSPDGYELKEILLCLPRNHHLFSLSRSILIAACEQKSFIVLDPTTRKDVHHVANAHSDCVNCVRYALNLF